MNAFVLSMVLAVAAAPQEKPVVYAWFPRDMNDWDTSRIDWPSITHLCLRSVVLQPDGSLKPGWNVQRMAEVVREARRRGVKVTVLAWGTDSKNSSIYLARHPEKTVQALLEFVKAHDLDGVNIDDETWREKNEDTGGPNRELVTRFFRILREKFKAARADYHLTYASPGVISPLDKYGDAWIDYKAVADLVDGF
ncbi:MAG TPA: glycosyl hydrolase family 18 protein, partial [Planctomycetota bacterium]|nr:glycosyl hydrolase family 18 protein [Planctomycetota bacterium]